MTEQEYRQTRFTRPQGATEILLVRHGESRAARVDEPFPLVDGQGDPELAPQGREQAELVRGPSECTSYRRSLCHQVAAYV